MIGTPNNNNNNNNKEKSFILKHYFFVVYATVSAPMDYFKNIIFWNYWIKYIESSQLYTIMIVKNTKDLPAL